MRRSFKLSAKKVLGVAIATAVFGAAGPVLAKPDTTRVIVSMKPGQASGGRAAVRAADARGSK